MHQQIREIVDRAKEVHGRERKLTLESLILIMELENLNACGFLNLSQEGFAKELGLSLNQYWKRRQAARVTHAHPDALELFEQGEIDLTHLVLIAARITEANCQVLLNGIRSKSKRDAEAFVSKVSSDGTVSEGEGWVEVRMKLKTSELKQLDRAREFLSAGSHVPSVEEIFLEALEALLDKKDPMRKAERAEKRKQASPVPAPGQKVEPKREMKKAPAPGQERKSSRPAIPAAIKHAVWKRDQAQCTWILGDRNRCPEKGMLELDHLKLWAWGGEHSVENLTLRCRRHNQFRGLSG